MTDPLDLSAVAIPVPLTFEGYRFEAPLQLEGTLIRLQVERLPGDRDPTPGWLWA